MRIRVLKMGSLGSTHPSRVGQRFRRFDAERENLSNLQLILELFKVVAERAPWRLDRGCRGVPSHYDLQKIFVNPGGKADLCGSTNSSAKELVSRTLFVLKPTGSGVSDSASILTSAGIHPLLTKLLG